jgi:chromosome segregation ATPase
MSGSEVPANRASNAEKSLQKEEAPHGNIWKMIGVVAALVAFLVTIFLGVAIYPSLKENRGYRGKENPAATGEVSSLIAQLDTISTRLSASLLADAASARQRAESVLSATASMQSLGERIAADGASIQEAMRSWLASSGASPLSGEEIAGDLRDLAESVAGITEAQKALATRDELAEARQNLRRAISLLQKRQKEQEKEVEELTVSVRGVPTAGRSGGMEETLRQLLQGQKGINERLDKTDRRLGDIEDFLRKVPTYEDFTWSGRLRPGKRQ